MTEAFDNKSSRTGELLETPRRIKILADAVIDLTGAVHPKFPDTVKDSEWVDARTGTTLKLQRKQIDEVSHYYLDHYNAYKFELGMTPVSQYYVSSQNYKVARLFTYTEHDGPTPEEENIDPTEEMYDFLTHGPLTDIKTVLKPHEEQEVDERFRHLVGTHAISSQTDVDKINRAYNIKNPRRHARALNRAVRDLIEEHKDDMLTEDYLRKAIERYWRSGYHSAYIVRPKKQ